MTESVDWLLEECGDPKWKEAGNVHDWRNHVTEEVRAIWHTFTDKQKYVLATAADYHAGNEEWE